MYNLAIIDDEALSRQCILKLLEKADLKISNIIEAEDSDSAFQKFDTIKPDIMLVDIHMPGLDGFKFIEEVRRKYNPLVQSIIISGYDYFDYSKKALQLKVYDYILKPVKKEDLIASISKSLAELNSIKQEKENIRILENTCQMKLLNDFLDNKETVNLKSVNHIIVKSSVQVKTTYLAMVIRCLFLDSCEKIPQHDYERIIEAFCENVLTGKYQHIFFKRFNNQFVLFLCSEDFSGLDVYVRQIDRLFKQNKQPAVIGIGSNIHSMAELAKSYHEAVSASREYLFHPEASFFYYSSVMRTDHSFSIYQYNILEKQTFDYINLGSYKAVSYFRDLFNISKYCSFLEWENRASYFLMSLQKILSENLIDRNLIKLFEDIKDNCSTLDEIVQWIISQIDEAVCQINVKKSSFAISNINKAIDYIKVHFNEELSLDYITSLAYMNKTYFCEIFKKITGKTYLQYVTGLRMDMAKELLKDKHMKLSEISDKCGYSNANYFEKVFKDNAGITIKDYRRQMK